MHWHLILEEYGPEVTYVKGEHNVVADALSRLNLLPNKPIQANLDQMAEHFGLDDDDLPADAFPLQYKMIAREQNKDKTCLNYYNQTLPAFISRPFVEAVRKENSSATTTK